MVLMILSYASETAVLLLSGCVSLVSVGGVCAAVAFVAYKNLVFFWPSKKKKETVDEPDSSQTEPLELNDGIKSKTNCHSDVLKAEKKPYDTLKDYLKVKVASTISTSTYDKDGEIREFLEHLVSNLISANLDDVPLNPLSDNDHYECLVEKYHPRLASVLTTLSASLHSDKDSESLDEAVRPSTLYGKLRSIIRDVEEEATLLPSLPDSTADFGPNSIESHLQGRNYEEILSTAVLNKIISRSQGIEFEPKNVRPDITSTSEAKDELKRSSSPKEKFSLTIEEHIEEITRYRVSDDDQDSLIESTTNCNLIGKHRAQFPELGKDIVDAKLANGTSKTNYMYKYDFNSSLETPTFKNDVDTESSEGFAGDHDLDSSGVTSISRDVSDLYSFSSISPCRSDEESLPWNAVREAKNEHVLLGQVDSGEGSLDTQPEHDETNFSSTEEPVTCEAINIYHSPRDVKIIGNDSSPEEELNAPPKPGTIAEREHKKWEQARPIPNNPYTKESIEKRNLDNFLPKTYGISTISNQYERNENENHTLNGAASLNEIPRYERDYYVNSEHTKSSQNQAEKRTRSMSEDQTPIRQNGCGIKPTLVSESSEKRKSNLVRVSSWSDRKKPDVEIRKRLPSVKELAKQFSGENNSCEVKRFPAPVTKNQMVHSLTARSMSKEFREGLKNNVNKTFNRNILSNGKDETDKLEENQTTEEMNLQIHDNGDNAIIY